MDLSHVKLVAIDLDGTLLDGNKQLNDYTKNTIQKLVATGTIVCFITGRSLNNSLEYAKLCGINGCIITSNGSEVREVNTDKILHQSFFLEEIAKDVISYFRRTKEFMWIYTSDGIYHENSNPLFEQFQKVLPNITSEYSSFDKLYSKVFKFLFLLRKEKATEIMKYTQNNFAESINSIYTNPSVNDPQPPYKPLTYVELLQKNTNKGTALKFLSKHYQIPLKDMLVFGDEDNDIEMLYHAGYAIVPDNAKQHIKDYAYHITSSNTDSGVAKFINKFFMIK